MPRQPRFPIYPTKKHPSGQARIRLGGRHVYLGVFGSPASWTEYRRLLGEWQAGRLSKTNENVRQSVRDCRTVNDLLAAWWVWAEQSQLDEAGKLKDDIHNRRGSYQPLVAVYGEKSVAEFGAGELLQLQQVMAKEWTRSGVNRATSRIKALFRWGELRRLVPEGSTARLLVVRGIAPGEHGARSTDEVPPVDPAVFEATLIYLRPVVRAVVELLALTGARPSELLGLRPIDINRTGSVELARGYSVELGAGVWAYQPAKHKTAYKGHRRVILFGPRAQAVLRPFLDRDPLTHCFSPAEEVARKKADARADRKTPVQPSQIDRSKPNRKRAPRDRYDHRSLQHAVKRAAERAGLPHWFPYQLRHLAATNLAAEFGPEIASIVLGHRHLSTTAIYALPSLQRAADAMRDVG